MTLKLSLWTGVCAKITGVEEKRALNFNERVMKNGSADKVDVNRLPLGKSVARQRGAPTSSDPGSRVDFSLCFQRDFRPTLPMIPLYPGNHREFVMSYKCF